MVVNNNVTKIGIIAGSGDLPYILIKELKKRSIEPYVVALNYGLASFLLLNSIAFIKCSVTEVRKAINFFNDNGIKSLIFIGKITRPNLFSIRPDVEAKKLLKKILLNIGGDDRVLSQVVDFFEKEHNFKVIGAQDYINDYTLSESIYDIADNIQKEDIDIGIEYLKETSKFDIGQAVVVRNRQIIAVEGAEGTDNMLKRVYNINRGHKYGGVFIKMPKNNQNLKIDLPTLGVKTVKLCYKAGIKAIAVEKGKCFVLDIPEITDFVRKNQISLLCI